MSICCCFSWLVRFLYLDKTYFEIRLMLVASFSFFNLPGLEIMQEMWLKQENN